MTGVSLAAAVERVDVPREEETATPATWYCVRGSNDTYWRVDVPAKAIGASVCKIDYATGREQLEQPGLVDRQFRWYLTDDGAEYPDHQGAGVFTRPDKPRATHALAMREQGARIVAEVDDNYLSARQLSLAMRHLHDDNDRKRHLEAMGCFDAIVVTTRWLRDYYAKALRSELKVRPDFHVCGNHVDPADWPERIERDGPLRVGWMGSPSHVWDIPLAYPALKWAADNGCEVVIIGMDPSWRPQTKLQIREGRFVPHPHHDNPLGFQYRHIPWVDPREFNRRLASYPLDIALAPLRRDEHTLGKSDVKILEYGMSGTAVVASNMEVYNGSIRHGENGLLAGGPTEFLHMTQELVRSARLRVELAASLQQYIREQRLIAHHADEWREAIGV